MTTTSEIKKGVDHEMQKLTPGELAQYIQSEERSIALDLVRRQITEKDAIARDIELEAIYNKHVLSLDIYDYAKFWREMYTEERRMWAREFFTTVLFGLYREEALNTLLIIEMHQVWVSEQDSTATQARREKHRDMIKGLEKRRQQIIKDMRQILNAGFWEKKGIERPDIAPSGEEFQSLIEDLLSEVLPGRTGG